MMYVGSIERLPERIPNYNERQAEELAKFEHVLGKIASEEKLTREKRTWGVRDTETNVYTAYFKLDQKFLGAMDRLAFNMYLGFVEESPKMKIAAEGILFVHHQVKGFEEDKETQGLKDIWNNSK